MERAVLRSGVGGSLALWAAMVAIDPVLVGALGTVDVVNPVTGQVIFADRLAWVLGQAAIVTLALWLATGSNLAGMAGMVAFGVLAAMLYGLDRPRPVFWGAGAGQQALFQAVLLGWLLMQRHWADWLAAACLFAASLIGLVLMVDAQLRMNGLEITAGDPALAFTVAYGTWAPPVIPLLGILMLAACAAYARRDPTWTPTTPGA